MQKTIEILWMINHSVIFQKLPKAADVCRIHRPEQNPHPPFSSFLQQLWKLCLLKRRWERGKIAAQRQTQTMIFDALRLKSNPTARHCDKWSDFTLTAPDGEHRHMVFFECRSPFPGHGLQSYMRPSSIPICSFPRSAAFHPDPPAPSFRRNTHPAGTGS